MNVALIFLLTLNSPLLRPKDKLTQTTTLHSLDCKSNSSVQSNLNKLIVHANFVLKLLMLLKSIAIYQMQLSMISSRL